MTKKTLLLLALATFGCAEKMDSTDVRTSGIRAEFEVISFLGDSNAKTQARAILYGGSDVIRLRGDDYLEVHAGGETKRMDRDGGDDYLATFDIQAEDTEFVFSLQRGDDDTDAPDSHVTLPPPFTVLGMENNGVVQEENGQVRVPRGVDVVLTWKEDDTDDDVNYGIGNGSDCLSARTGSAGKNNGSVTIPASIFRAKAGQEDSVCGATLYVELERKGERDAAFKSGTVRAKQRYWINFVSTP